MNRRGLSALALFAFSLSIAIPDPLKVLAADASGASSQTSQQGQISPQVIDAGTLNNSTGFSVASGSTAILDFGNSQTLNLNGNLNNNGTLIFASSNPAVSTAGLFASGIVNQTGASMSTVLTGLSGFYPIQNLTLSSSGNIANYGNITSSGNLSLIANQQIMNSGTIASQANLSMTAASIINTGAVSALQNLNLQSANLVNQGQISAALGNINIAGTITGNILINNTGGSISALNGVINLRDALYDGIAELQIDGGRIAATAININNGSGAILAQLDSLTGTVNATGYSANLGVSDQNLRLGTLSMSGDPTYYNGAGDITIDGNIQVGENLAIIAAGNIIGTNNANLITTTDLGGKGHNIYLVAGANITAGAAPTNTINNTPPVTGNASANVSFDGVGSGGDIDFSASPNLKISGASTCAGCSGGDIVMAAYANGATGGKIILPGPSPGSLGLELNSSSTSGNAGNVTLIAGAQTGSTIDIARIDARGQGAAGTGTVRIDTAQPVSSDGNPTTFDTLGNLISGNNLIASNSLNTVQVNLHDNINANQISINAGGNISAVEAVFQQIFINAGAGATALNPAGTRVYTLDSPNNSMIVIDTSTNTVINTVSTGSLPGAIAVSPDGSRIYVAEQGQNTVSIFDSTTLNQIGVIPTGNQPNSIALNGDGSVIYVTAAGDQTLASYNTGSRTLINTVNLPGTPTSIGYVNADSSVYVGIGSGAATVFSYNTITGSTSSVLMPSDPTAIGACPCGTKLFVPTPGSGSVQEMSLIGLPLSGINTGTSPVGAAVTPNGAYVYLTNPTDNSISVIQTLTSTVKTTVPVSVNANTSGQFAGFVSDTPTAYIPNGNNMAVIKTPTLFAQNINLNSQSGDIAVASGASSNLVTNSGGSTVITSNRDLSSSSAASGAALQFATTGSLAFNGAVSAVNADFHAINGSFTNNSTITMSGVNFTIASSNIINNGTLSINNAGGDAALNIQAPGGNLNITLAAGSLISSDAAGSGFITLNPGRGTSVSVQGQGSMIASECVHADGVAGNYTVNMNMLELGNSFQTINNNPKSVSITTQQGDIFLCDSIDTSSSTGSGGSIFLQANGGAVFSQGSLISDGAGQANKAGAITLIAQSGIAILGQISANGNPGFIGGADGGNITLSSPDQFVVVQNPGSGGVSATATGGGNGGSITINTGDIGIYALNSNNSSLDVSSDQGSAGRISVTVTDKVDPLIVGCGGCNSVEGDIQALGAVNGGRIDLNVAAGIEIDSGYNILADGGTGSGGTIQFLGIPGQTLNVFNDGFISAMNNAGNSGVVGFNSFFEGGVNLTGCGCGLTQAGYVVAFGNLDPATALPINPIFFPPTDNFQYGSISAVQGFPIGNIIAVGRAPVPVVQTQTVSASLNGGLGLPNPNTPNLLANTTISSTDQTPEARRTTFVLQALNGYVREDQGTGIAAALAFSSDLEALKNQGINVQTGSGPNSIYLKDGNILFIAAQDTMVETDFGSFFIHAGNIVFLMADSKASTAFNLHDDLLNVPSVIAGGKKTSFAVGQEIALSKDKALVFDKRISFRNAEQLATLKSTTIHSAQFSLISAISAIRPLRSMRNSGDPSMRKAAAQIMKNAAILSILGLRFGAYNGER